MKPEDRVKAELLGRRFDFLTSRGLFSGDRIDDGTRLLLGNLPAGPPARVLDLGCGYGALGLPVAALYPGAECLLVDRDLLAVDLARRNAQSHALDRVEARPSLGYRDVGGSPFDWILCNVPARIGESAIAYFLGEGARRLTAQGELRVVVINDLKHGVEALAARAGWPLRRCAEGARHAVYALPGGLPALGEPSMDPEGPYVRDRLEVAGLSLERPADVSEEPAHAGDGLPLLLELLPRAAPKTALVWRSGYGAVAISLAARGAAVRAGDRDLLATAFTRRNAARLGHPLHTREVLALEQMFSADERFELVTGEIHPTTSEEDLARDLLASTRCVREGGLVLWLGLTRKGRRAVEALARAKRLSAAVLASRGPYTVWRVFPLGLRAR